MESLGDYVLKKKIGEGGFGEVFLAEHRFLKKPFALKVLSEKLSADKAFIERFEKDIGVIASLDHPSIVKVHNISYDQGRYFIVMDSVGKEEGSVQNLAEYLSIRTKVLPEKEIEMILRQIASALDYAHRLALDTGFLIHRSLKLSNILVDESEKGLRVFLTDFSQSHYLGEENILKSLYEKMTDDQFSFSKRFQESYHFLSPEQKSGEGVDVVSDTYSFGVLAYYLITRNYPQGYFQLPSKIAPEYKLNWDLFVSQCLQTDMHKRPQRLTETLNISLSTQITDPSSLEVLSWEEVEKKVENAMQMSFQFNSSIIDEDDEISTDVEQPSEYRALSSMRAEPKPVIQPTKIERPAYEPDPGAIFQKELNVSHYQPQKMEIVELDPIHSEMIVVPGGTYYRGSNHGARDEMPRHKISVSSFALDIHSVTNEQFVRFLEVMGGEKDHNNNDIVRLRDSRLKRTGGRHTIESGYAKHPVVGVTWYGAVAYAKWVGKRLPTEAEWEVAAAGGLEDMLYSTGKDIDHTQANFFSSDTTAAKSYPPNGFGVYDMVGNVYEWCEDWYAYNYYDTSIQEPENPIGPSQGIYRVLRGGCWKSLKDDLRTAHRHRNNPGAVNGTYGFRCAADVSS